MNIPFGGKDSGEEMVLLAGSWKHLHQKVVSSAEGDKGAAKIKGGGKIPSKIIVKRGEVYARSFS